MSNETAYHRRIATFSLPVAMSLQLRAMKGYKVTVQRLPEIKVAENKRRTEIIMDIERGITLLPYVVRAVDSSFRHVLVHLGSVPKVNERELDVKGWDHLSLEDFMLLVERCELQAFVLHHINLKRPSSLLPLPEGQFNKLCRKGGPRRHAEIKLARLQFLRWGCRAVSCSGLARAGTAERAIIVLSDITYPTSPAEHGDLKTLEGEFAEGSRKRRERSVSVISKASMGTCISFMDVDGGYPEDKRIHLVERMLPPRLPDLLPPSYIIVNNALLQVHSAAGSADDRPARTKRIRRRASVRGLGQDDESNQS